MSQLSELIDELCPEGVEYQKLGEIGLSLNGMSAVSNKWADKGNCQFIDYMNAYKNIKIDVTKLPYATVKDTTKQTILRKGDILFTSASEVPNECALSGVIEDEIKEGIFMDDHLFGLRLNDNFKDKIITGYLKYIFRANDFRKQVLSTVRGVTRFYIAKPAFMKLSIPVPPLPIQEEIVRILDKYTSLEVELEEKLEVEAEARKQQYEYYREKLLTFDKGKVEFKTMGEIGTFVRGNGLQKNDFTEDGIPCIHYGQIYTYYGTFAEKTKSFVSEESAKKFKKAKKGDIIIACTSENIEDVCKCVAWLGDEDICISGHSCVFLHKQNPKYIAYFLQTNNFFAQKKKYAYGIKVIEIKISDLEKIKIPVPPLAEQQRIVSILDKLEKTTTDLTKEILEEKEARHQQYEYYREKLLTFKRKEMVEV